MCRRDGRSLKKAHASLHWRLFSEGGLLLLDLVQLMQHLPCHDSCHLLLPPPNLAPLLWKLYRRRASVLGGGDGSSWVAGPESGCGLLVGEVGRKVVARYAERNAISGRLGARGGTSSWLRSRSGHDRGNSAAEVVIRCAGLSLQGKRFHHQHLQIEVTEVHLEPMKAGIDPTVASETIGVALRIVQGGDTP